MALVYGYVPYLILPLYAALDRIDQRLIEAARDLGAPPRRRVLARRRAALEDGHAGRHRADRAADVRRLLHAGPDVGLAQDLDARQRDQRLRAGRARQVARRGADAAAVARSCSSSCSITCASCGATSARPRDRDREPPSSRPPPARSSMRDAVRRTRGGGRASSRSLTWALHRLVAAAGPAGDPLRVQLGPLADVAAGLVAALVLEGPDAQRLPRPDAAGRAQAQPRPRGARAC